MTAAWVAVPSAQVVVNPVRPMTNDTAASDRCCATVDDTVSVCHDPTAARPPTPNTVTAITDSTSEVPRSDMGGNVATGGLGPVRHRPARDATMPKWSERMMLGVAKRPREPGRVWRPGS